MKTCKKRVYKTMCEKDDGQRTGKYGAIKYQSTKKFTKNKRK